MAQYHDLIAAVPPAGIGVDIGSTLVKVARVVDGDVSFAHCPATDRERVQTLLGDPAHGALACTGAGSAGWSEPLAPWAPRMVSEFTAIGTGVRAVLAREKQVPDAAFLVASVGTGTSILHVTDQRITRVGGSAMGGGTLMGLGQLLCGTTDYAELVRLAAAGNRQQVDLLVGDVYPDGIEDVFRELTAANFGWIRSQAPEDLAQGLCGLLGENLGLICGGLARLHGVSQVVYCGATLMDNPILTGVLLATTAYAGAPAHALPDGAYCAALGALVHLGCPAEDDA